MNYSFCLAKYKFFLINIIFKYSMSLLKVTIIIEEATNPGVAC